MSSQLHKSFFSNFKDKKEEKTSTQQPGLQLKNISHIIKLCYLFLYICIYIYNYLTVFNLLETKKTE